MTYHARIVTRIERSSREIRGPAFREELNAGYALHSGRASRRRENEIRSTAPMTKRPGCETNPTFWPNEPAKGFCGACRRRNRVGLTREAPAGTVWKFQRGRQGVAAVSEGLDDGNNGDRAMSVTDMPALELAWMLLEHDNLTLGSARAARDRGRAWHGMRARLRNIASEVDCGVTVMVRGRFWE